MKKNLDLIQMIELEKINLDENLKIPNILGIYINIPGINPTIGIKRDLNNTKEYCSILAEEIGHHFKTINNLIIKNDSYIKKILIQKEEFKARLWAANFLISDEEFVQAILNCINNKYELSEKFDVTEDIINYKILSICIDENKYNDIKNKLKMHEVAYSACEI